MTLAQGNTKSKLALTLVVFIVTTFSQAKPKISIIIDDVGNNYALDLWTTKLPKQVGLSILPQTSFSKKIANIAHQKKMDVLLHQPMESIDSNNLLGPGALLTTMTREEFKKVLRQNLKDLPYVVGLNNHMGSLLTTNQQKMNWLMAELSERSLYFIDSRTTAKTLAENTAVKWNVASLSRKVFLDHVDDPAAIAVQFQRLLKVAKKYGYAIAIGHPRKNTLEFLEKALTQNNPNFELIKPSKMMTLNFPPPKTLQEYLEDTNF